MTGSKIVLSGARDIPLNKLALSQANVRRIKAGVSVEELAEDIARRGLLQSLSVRPVLDEQGTETGAFEVPAGGRRYQALQLLVKQKRLAKNASVPCIVKTDGVAEEDSLAENTMREALHPLDQFRAFRNLREQHGLGDEEIAARFFVTPAVVRQRLKLVAASPALLSSYEAGELTLEQLMAFCVTGDHARQEEVLAFLANAYNKEPYYIRRILTERSVRATDRRAEFVGAQAFEAAGGTVARDLFGEDHGGYFEDPALLDRLVAEKLEAIAEAVWAEGWKWVEVRTDFPYGHTGGLRRLPSTRAPLSEDEQTGHDALRAEQEALEREHEACEDLPEGVDARLGEIEAELAPLEDRPATYDFEEVARAGVFVSLDYDGTARVDRGFVRPEDEAPVLMVEGADVGPSCDPAGAVHRLPATAGGSPTGTSTPEAEADEETLDRPLSERLMMELTTHRTMALRDALSQDPDAAFLAVLHAMVLKVFGSAYGTNSCLEVQVRVTQPDRTVPGLAQAPGAIALLARQQVWSQQIPGRPKAVWDFLIGLDGDSRADLFALCTSVTLNAMHLPHDRRPDAIAHADRVAELVGLDMSVNWQPTADNFFGRVTKGRILASVREAKGEPAAQLIDHLKKNEMAQEAERLVRGTGWLPQPLRTPDDGTAKLALTADATEGSKVSTARHESTVIGPNEDDLPAFLGGDVSSGELEPYAAIAAE